jgi:flavodoxin
MFTMKVWILYDSKFGHCKKLAETLEDLLEDDFDVCVGNAKKISPDDVLVEKPDAILVGGPIHFGRPSRVITSWMKGCFALSQSSRVRVEKAFAFTTRCLNFGAEGSWIKLFHKYHFASNHFSQVLSIKVFPRSKLLSLKLTPDHYTLIEGLKYFLLNER